MANGMAHQRRTLTLEIARALVRELAPQELKLFDTNANRYLDLAGEARRRGADPDEMLGFGLDDLLPAVTAGALGIAGHSVRLVLGDADKPNAGARFLNWVRRLFGRRPPAAPQGLGLQLTPDQLSRVRERAREAALRSGLPPIEADRVTDAVLAQLSAAT